MDSDSVSNPLSMGRVTAIREALFARQFPDECLENEHANVVCDRISLLDVTKFLGKHDSLGFGIRFEPEDVQNINVHPGKIMGKLIALEVPSFTHESAASEITDQIKEAVRNIVDEQTLRSFASPTIQIGAHLKEPDSSVGPRRHESETVSRKPTTVVEVAYWHGTTDDLKRSLSLWISPESYVQNAIGIKVSRTLGGSNRRMLAPLY